MIASRSEKILHSIPPSGEFLLRSAKQLRKYIGRGGGHAQSAAPELSAPPSQVPVEEIRAFLEKSCVKPDSVVMVHSDSRAIQAMGWSAPDFLDLLQSVVSPHGTLMMPSHAALRKANGLEVYDPQRSPSTVGLLTELFRRRPGVVRSLYPLSPAAAFGARAGEMIGEHRDSYAPHDEKSPYYKMIGHGAKVVCVGVPLDRMTLIHVAEDVLRHDFPIPNFYERRIYGLRMAGELTKMTVHARAAWLWWYLAKYRWSREICRRGFVRGVCWNGVLVRVADARGLYDWMAAEVRRGRTIYPLAQLNTMLRLGDPRMGESL